MTHRVVKSRGRAEVLDDHILRVAELHRHHRVDEVADELRIRVRDVERKVDVREAGVPGCGSIAGDVDALFDRHAEGVELIVGLAACRDDGVAALFELLGEFESNAAVSAGDEDGGHVRDGNRSRGGPD